MTMDNENNGTKPQGKRDLKPRQKRFCQLYVIDWNGAKAYKEAYGPCVKDTVCRANASRLLAKDIIQDYIKTINADLEKAAGISKLGIILEHKKIAFSSISQLHDTWITRKSFDELTDEQKACIAEISTQIKTTRNTDGTLEENEYVKVKLYDKQKSLDSLCRLFGYDKDMLERLDDQSLDELLDRLKQNR